MSDKKISQLTASTTPLAGTEVLPIVQSGTTKQVSVSNLTAGRDVAAKSLTVSGEGTYAQGKIFSTSGEGVLIGAKTGSFFDAGLLKASLDAYIWTVATGTQNFKTWGETTIGNNGTQNHTVNGTLVIASAGKGIDFSATSEGSGTMTSELLADYEEGTFTPSLKFGGASVGLTYFQQWGSYTKVGNLVTAIGKIYIDSVGSSTGEATIEGLPYTSGDMGGPGRRYAVAMAAYAGNQLMQGALPINSTTITLMQNVTGPYTAVTNAGFAQYTEIQFTVSYQV